MIETVTTPTINYDEFSDVDLGHPDTKTSTSIKPTSSMETKCASPTAAQVISVKTATQGHYNAKFLSLLVSIAFTMTVAIIGVYNLCRIIVYGVVIGKTSSKGLIVLCVLGIVGAIAIIVASLIGLLNLFIGKDAKIRSYFRSVLIVATHGMMVSETILSVIMFVVHKRLAAGMFVLDCFITVLMLVPTCICLIDSWNMRKIAMSSSLEANATPLNTLPTMSTA